MRFSLNPQIHIGETTKAFLEELPLTLLRAGYKANVENALKFESDIIDFINLLPTSIHYPIKPQFYHHFVRYGSPTHYAFFKRKSSPSTTWYVFFSKQGNRYLVKHIGTNWTDGQYIR